MTINCNNINLKQGSKGDQVKEVQTRLSDLGYYSGKIDGDYGQVTASSVKAYQKNNGLLQDGVFGPVTCNKINSSNGIYISRNHHEGRGCNKGGQCNGRCCGPHSIRQSNSKGDIDQFLESQLSSWAGTTSAGTGHGGLETAVYEVGRRAGWNIKITWKNFSDFGKTLNERFEALGKIIENNNKKKYKTIIWHNLYRNQYGHYEVVKEINMKSRTVKVLNSLGNRCGGESYCGYIETRTFETFAKYLSGISQKSIMILEYEKK